VAGKEGGVKLFLLFLQNQPLNMENRNRLILFFSLLGFIFQLNAQTTDVDTNKIQGKREIYCPDCKGEGYIVIYSQNCERCQGSGEITCTYCYGKGFIYETQYNNETQSDMEVKVPCRVCGGVGSFRCTSCSGRGFINESSKNKCQRCEGRGFIFDK
jgi:DnaJ-class molecular chaperone